jgi:hypothetical protein
LSAAHCFKNDRYWLADADSWVAIAGLHKREVTSQQYLNHEVAVYDIETVDYHLDYTPPSHHNDIAILTIQVI